MTVPSSGEISLGKIRQELESTSTSNDYNEGPYTSAETSLSASETGVYATINTGSEDRPDGVGPFAMSEWRGYGQHIGWSFTWDQTTTHHAYPHISGSKSAQNTAPTNTVADQILISGSLQNYTTAEFTGNSAYSGQDSIIVVWIEESGSVTEPIQPIFTVARGGDPGVDGTDNKGQGWITGSTAQGRHASSFADRSVWVSAYNGDFYFRLAASGSATTTPGESYERELWVANGQYSASMTFTVHGTS